MAKVAVTDDTLRVEIAGLDKLLSLKSRLEIPLLHVRGATSDPDIKNYRNGWRGPGTYVPGVITAGTFHQAGDRVFWDVHNPAKAVVIELDGEPYQRLVIEVDEPRAVVNAVNRAVAAHSARTGQGRSKDAPPG